MQHPLHHPLHGVVLVGAHHHQDLFRPIEHHVFADHGAQVPAVQESRGEGRQPADRLVVLAGPVKGLLEGLLAGVGVILRVHPVGDHEELHEVVEARAAPVAVFLVTLDLVEGLLHLQPAPLQFDLHQRQAVGDERHIISVLVLPLHAHLLGDLPAVALRVRAIEKLQIRRGAVAAVQLHPVAKDLRFLEDVRAFREVMPHLREFARRERHVIEGLQLRLQVRQHRDLIIHIRLRIAHAGEVGHQFVFENLFGLGLGSFLEGLFTHR